MAIPSSLEAPRYGTWGVDLKARDLRTPAGQDFFRYAVGTSVGAMKIPDDRSRWGTFDLLADLSLERGRAIIEKAAANTATSGEAAQIGGLYKSFINEAAVEKLDIAPLRGDLDQIGVFNDRRRIARLMGRAPFTFNGAFFAPFVYDDQRNPQRYAVYLGQAGLGLPDRDYYLQDNFKTQKEAYRNYVAQVLTLIGWPDAAKQADAIVALETAIAEVSWTRAERRDDVKMYNLMTKAELIVHAPGFDWDAYFKSAGLDHVERFVVGEKTAFPKIAEIFAKTPIETLQAWQAFTTTDAAAPYLSSRFSDARFNFRLKTLSGQQAQRPRWKRGVQVVESTVGEALGHLYVEEYFPAESKAQMEVLVANLKGAMKGRIEKAEWMSAPTKAEALTKLAKIRVKIGYPDKWRDYSPLVIRDDDLYGNIKRGLEFEWNYQLGRMGGPTDPEEWGMTPQTVNAYYNSVKNEIVFPAAILQPPMFDPKANPAVNYGAIGAVIGHEITHGFDDQGRNSDADGKLRDWWTPADAERFKAEAAKLGKQYSGYELFPGHKINGDLTMGENIADLGGLLVAHDAYLASLGGKPAPVIDGVTGEQRFFLGFAQVWAGQTRDDEAKQRLVSDPHSPQLYRVNGVLPNMDSWDKAFAIKPGDKMYLPPSAKVRIW